MDSFAAEQGYDASSPLRRTNKKKDSRKSIAAAFSVLKWKKEGLRVSKKRNKRFDVGRWVQSQIEKRVQESLAEQNHAFAREHQNDTDEQLLDYLRQSAALLGDTPGEYAIIGGKIIAARFGSWSRAVQAAGLKPPAYATKKQQAKSFQEEYARQTELFHQEWLAQKREKDEARKQRDTEKAEKQKLRSEQERLWEEAHREDSDEQILEYLRQCAAELGHSPTRREVEGSAYISQRFLCWSVALTCADLPLPPGSKPIKPAVMKEYQRTRMEREQARRNSVQAEKIP